MINKSSSSGDNPDADLVISVTGEEGVTVRGPGEGDALVRDGVLSLFALLEVSWLELTNANLGFQVPDLDRTGGGSAQPVSGGRKDQSMDDVIGNERREVTSLVEVPQHSGTVFATRGAQRTIRGHSNGVDITGVTHQVGSEFAVVEVPDLDNLVPSSGNDEGSVKVGRESDARNPLGVTIFGHGVLASTQSVPQVDGLVTGSGDNLSVVSGESNTQNIVGVVDKSLGSGARSELPQSQGAIPRSREGELTIRRDGNILDEVAVSGQASSGVTISGLIIGGDLPMDDGLITRGRQNHVWGFAGGSDGCDPTAMTLQNSFYF